MEAAVATELSAAFPCVRCGYDLRGHDSAGRCPECGLDAYWTLRAPQKLSEYPADWVRAMSWGVRLLALTYAELFVVLLLGFTGWLDNNNITPVVGLLLAGIVQLPGMWLLSRYSGHLREKRAPLNRWLLRLTPLGLLSASLAGAVILIDYHTALQWIVSLGMLVAGITPTVAFIRLRAVARLVANATLAEYSAIVGWGFLIVCAGMLGLVLFLQGQSMTRTIDMAFVAIVTASLLLFLLWGAFILICCVIDFGRADRIAQKQWNPQAPEVSSDVDAGSGTAL
jgi:hypothetical protein